MNASVIISLCSLALAFIVFLSNRSKDSNVAAAREARVDAKLDGISNGVNELRLDMRSMDKRIGGAETRLTQVEGREADDRRRIDDLEAKFNQAHPPA